MKSAKKTNLNSDQIRGQIASMQSELGKLEREHRETVETFERKVGANQKRHAELTGGIAALQALLG